MVVERTVVSVEGVGASEGVDGSSGVVVAGSVVGVSLEVDGPAVRPSVDDVDSVSASVVGFVGVGSVEVGSRDVGESVGSSVASSVVGIVGSVVGAVGVGASVMLIVIASSPL